MLLLELDANSPIAAWVPFLVVLVLAIAMVFLFRSMRHQLGRIQVPKEGVEIHPEADADDRAGQRR